MELGNACGFFQGKKKKSGFFKGSVWGFFKEKLLFSKKKCIPGDEDEGHEPKLLDLYLPLLSPENPPSGSSLPPFPMIYGIQGSIFHVIPGSLMPGSYPRNTF